MGHLLGILIVGAVAFGLGAVAQGDSLISSPGFNGLLALPVQQQTGEVDYYALTVSGDQAMLAFHIPVPAGTNDAGLTYVACIDQRFDAPTSAVPWISAARLTALDSGQFIERVVTVQIDADLTPIQKRNRADAVYNQQLPLMQDQIRQECQFWGFERDVP